jgi:glycosyltransferase involved in cell wall biosynthesis
MRRNYRKNILYLFTSTNYYGAKKHFEAFIEYADFKKINMTVIVLRDNFPSKFKEDFKSIKFEEFNFETLNSWLKWLKYLSRYRPDQIVFSETWFTHFKWPAIFAGWLVTKGNVYMVEHTDIPANLGYSRNLFRFWPKFKFREDNWRIRALLCKRILTVSESMKKKMVQFYRYPESKIEVAYCPIDTNRFAPMQDGNFEIRKRHGVKKGDLVCIVVSRLEKAKGVEKAIEAFRLLIEVSHRRDIWLWVLGDGSLREALNRNVETGNIVDRVIFFGYKDSVENYLKESDIFISASEYEAFGLALLQAMSAGLVCVSTCTGGAKEIVKDKGFIVEHSAESIFQALFYLINMNKREFDDMRIVGRRHILENFDKRSEGKKHLSALGIPAI